MGRQESATGAMYKDGTYLSHNPTWHEEDAQWKARQILKMLKKNSITPGSVCEVGCGSGAILEYLSKEMGAATVYTGFEISPQAYELCKQRISNRLVFYNEDFLRSKFGPVDLLMVIDVIEHIEDYFTFMRGLKNRSGYKIFHIPLDMSMHMVARGSPIMRVRRDVGHIHYFMMDTAIAVLRETGYEIIDYFYTPGMLDLGGRGVPTKIMNIPRRLLFSMRPDFAVRILGGYSLLVLAK